MPRRYSPPMQRRHLAFGPRVYVPLVRGWFYALVSLIMLLGALGADVIAVLVVAFAFAVVAIPLLDPRRSWWRPAVLRVMRTRRLVRRWTKQDLVGLVVLVLVGVLARRASGG